MLNVPISQFRKNTNLIYFTRSLQSYWITSVGPWRSYGIIDSHKNLEGTLFNFSIRTVQSDGLASSVARESAGPVSDDPLGPVYVQTRYLNVNIFMMLKTTESRLLLCTIKTHCCNMNKDRLNKLSAYPRLRACASLKSIFQLVRPASPVAWRSFWFALTVVARINAKVEIAPPTAPATRNIVVK